MATITLVLNVGSSSVKFAVARKKKIFLRGIIDHFGRRAGVQLLASGRPQNRTANIPNLRAAFAAIHLILAQRSLTPDVVAHRIVHGGQRLSRATRLTPTTLRYLHSLVELAPLHQAANLLGVTWARRAWPAVVEWGMFDTAIYRALPVKVRTYALPANLTKRLRIEKYGFHGLAHSWAFHQAAKNLHVSPRLLSAVTVHLGSGASMTLWRRGRPIDTTMGFTPLEGLVMTTRSGDIDPAIPLYIQERLGWSAKKVERLLEQHAGLIGLSGLRDMRDVLSAIGRKVPNWPRRRWPAAMKDKAQRALDVFTYHVRRTLAGYLGLVKIQTIVFTGPIGVNPLIQKIILHELPAAKGIQRLTVPADEEQAIVEAVQP